MPERHDHGKNFGGKDRIKLYSKSLISQVYDLLARHRATQWFGVLQTRRFPTHAAGYLEIQPAPHPEKTRTRTGGGSTFFGAFALPRWRRLRFRKRYSTPGLDTPELTCPRFTKSF